MRVVFRPIGTLNESAAIAMPAVPREGESVELDPDTGYTIRVHHVSWTPFAKNQAAVVRYIP